MRPYLCGLLAAAAAASLAAAPSAAPQVDVAIAHFEITQGLQNKDNTIPLAAGRATVVRVFPKVIGPGGPVAGVSARLRVFRNGAEVPGSPIAPNGPAVTAAATFDRADPAASLDFSFDPAWESGSTKLVAELVLPAGVADPVLANNRFPLGAAQFEAKFVPRRGLSLRYVTVRYTNPQWQGLREPRARVTEQSACDFLRSLYPTDPTLITYDPFTPDRIEFGQGDANGALDGDQLITELNALLGPGTTPDRLFAWTPDSTYPSNGLSDPLWAGGLGRVAFGNDTGDPNEPRESRWRRTFAHEIGHNTDTAGLQHTDRRLGDGEYGYDVLRVDPFKRTVMRHYPDGDPDGKLALFDVMRGGEKEPHAWITPDHYNALFNFLKPAVADAAPPAPEREQKMNLLVVRGSVTKELGGRFYPFYLAPASDEAVKRAADNPKKGTHELRFYRGEAEAEDARIGWTPEFSHAKKGKDARDAKDDDLSSRPFSFFVRLVDGLTRVDLLVNGKVVATQKGGAEPPKLANLNQSAVTQSKDSNDPKDRVVRVKWENGTTDAGGSLTHQVYFSNDDGKTWKLVATGLTKPEALVNVGSLPGGRECRFQVRTTDGLKTTVKTLERFELETSPPKVTIAAPRAGTAVLEGAGLLLIGRGHDVADGALPTGRLEWVSDLQKQALGTGEKVMVRDLKPGTHKITLRDKDNPEKSFATVTVTVQAKDKK